MGQSVYGLTILTPVFMLAHVCPISFLLIMLNQTRKQKSAIYQLKSKMYPTCKIHTYNKAPLPSQKKKKKLDKREIIHSQQEKAVKYYPYLMQV